MTTNRDWLFSLPLEDQYAWMNAEHAESPTSATMQHIGQVIEDTVKRGVYGDTESESDDSRELLEADVRNFAEKSGWLYPMAGTRIVLEWLDRQRAIDDSICDECSSNYYEMQEEHDQMIDGIAKLMRLKQPYTFDPDKPLKNIEVIGRYIDELQTQVDELTQIAESKRVSFADRIRFVNEIDELTAERDNLKANNEQLHTLAGEQAAKIDELQSAFGAICANLSIIANGEPDMLADIAIETIDALIDECNTANRQCEQYRKLFGMALDWAHEITMLETSIDEGMA